MIEREAPQGVGKAMVAIWGGFCLRCGGFIGVGESMVWLARTPRGQRNGQRSKIAHPPGLSCGPGNKIHNEEALRERTAERAAVEEESRVKWSKLHPRIARRKAMGLS